MKKYTMSNKRHDNVRKQPAIKRHTIITLRIKVEVDNKVLLIACKISGSKKKKEGFTNTFHEVNVKPGGVWWFTMHGPDNMNFPNLILFKEVVRPERLVYEHGSGEDDDPNKFNVVIIFEDQGNKTKLTMRSVFPTVAIRDMVIREYGAIEGGNQTLDRLEQELVKM